MEQLSYYIKRNTVFKVVEFIGDHCISEAVDECAVPIIQIPVAVVCVSLDTVLVSLRTGDLDGAQ